MQKRILLGAAAFLLTVAAYFVLSYGDNPRKRPERPGSTEAVRRFVSIPTSQRVQPLRGGELPFSPGEEPHVRVYDDVTGRLKYELSAETWEPTGEGSEFHANQLRIQIYTPRGEVTDIRADQADLTVSRRSGDHIEARRGMLQGNVRIVIDRTTREWRAAHPDLAERDAHAVDLIHINMDRARFDMDRAELFADGAVVVDSREVRIEQVRDLTVQWDQVDNRIEVLRFAQGGRMDLRRGAGRVSFALPGGERKREDGPGATSRPDEVAAARFAMETPRAQANQPMSIQAITAAEAAAAIRLEGGSVSANRPVRLAAKPPTAGPTAKHPADLRDPDVLTADMEAMQREARSGIAAPALESEIATVADLPAPKRGRVHTYRAVFHNEVLARHLDGEQTIGTLEADKMEVHFDFGKRQKRLVAGPDLAGIGSPRKAGRAGKEGGSRQAPAMPDDSTAAPDRSRLILTWNGPLELRPIPMAPEQQTGKRFDVVATGAPVKVHSEQGDAACRQLVYRNERRQVWLSGTEDEAVEMSVGPARRLVGREVFFDQKRGLARVEGPGHLFDRDSGRLDLSGKQQARAPVGEAAGTASASVKQREAVEIKWTRGVDLELGSRTVRRMNPRTGLMEPKEKEYLRRAWLHGEVLFKQGDQQLNADEVAVTFAPPASADAVADAIEHLNMIGDVRLERGDDVIAAQRLDVEMVVAPDGRNIPRIVDAAGEVLARQSRQEIRADRMHVVLGRHPGKMRLAPDGKTRIMGKAVLGIETLEADGRVLVRDPGHNLKISRADSLEVAFRNANELTRATIVSPNPNILARARYEDMAIHGHRIEIDMDRQSVDVPGPGKSWMVAREDFGARRLGRPAVVKTTWQKKMQLRMAQNYGVFMGHVHSESRGLVLNSDKLTIRFALAPPVKRKRGEDFLHRFGILGAIRQDRAELEFASPATTSMQRKRPTYIVAEGNAEALSSTYAAAAPNGEPGRLVSRARIAGSQIVADLSRQQMSVPCAGTLLLEDYQFDSRASGGDRLRTARVGGPLMSSVRSDGPSQTLITWANAMDLFVDRGLVEFDKNISMIHRSGRKMVLKDALAESMRLDPAALEQIGSGRKATLSCEHLLLEFQSAEETDKSDSIVRATDLKRLIARRAVHLQEGTMSLMGDYLQYLKETNEVRLEGSELLEARIIDQDEARQKLNMWRGPLLIWNRATNEVEATRANIRTSRR
ncbi:MAG: hypothetical protein ACE5E1_08670 [Phycisphaerae bacterium]